MEQTENESIFFLRSLKIIFTLAQVVAQGNKDYDLLGDPLKKQTKESLENLLNGKGNMVSELNRLGIEPTKEHMSLVNKTRIIWRKLKEKKEYEDLPQNICSLEACYQA